VLPESFAMDADRVARASSARLPELERLVRRVDRHRAAAIAA
jgi:hypothetical protein